MAEENVVVYSLYIPGEEHHTASIDPDDFGEIVADYVRQFQTAPVAQTADICITSMPREKWEAYEDA